WVMLLWIREALAPFLRIARGAKHSVDGDRRFRIVVKDGIWKAPYQGSALGRMNARIHLRLAADALHTRIDGTQKLLPQPDSAIFVPNVRFRNIEFGFWRSNYSLAAIPAAHSLLHLFPGKSRSRVYSEDSLFCAPVPAFASR